MAQSVKFVNVQEDNVPINGGEGVERCDSAELDGKEKNKSENPSGDEKGKLNDKNNPNLAKSDDDGKNGESNLGKP